jgi:hypothetical protein
VFTVGFSVLLVVVCAVVALFCALALGLGPLVFGAAGILMAAAAFRSRARSWWALGASAGGAIVAAGALLGWRTRTTVETASVLFALASAAWVAGHLRPALGDHDARRSPPRRPAP